ncbi:MAG: hypothetical protein ACRCXY_11385 [Fusobacteriaceae bacterium]
MELPSGVKYQDIISSSNNQFSTFMLSSTTNNPIVYTIDLINPGVPVNKNNYPNLV